jgi:aldose 1-epimerase
MIERSHYGSLRDGRPVESFTLRNGRGANATIIPYGGILTSLTVTDGHGAHRNIVLGYDTLAEYEDDPAHHGALIGRYANRIAGGHFSLDGRDYAITRNKGGNTLHGGQVGFDRKLWTVEAVDDTRAVRLSYTSADGEEGFPGTLNVSVEYSLAQDSDTLVIAYRATTDKPAIINLTNHAYFNLSGAETIEDHDIAIAADFFTPVNRDLIPTGEIRAVDDTPLDLRKSVRIGNGINASDEQIALAGGYDHNFVLRPKPAGEIAFAARAQAKASRLAMDVWTSEPGVQFYTGNSLRGQSLRPGGNVHKRRSALCLETQHFPDSPHHPNFPSTVLRPGDVFLSRTEYRFTAL